MKRFCLCSLRSHLLNVFTFFPLTGACSEGLDAFIFFFKPYCGKKTPYTTRLMGPTAVTVDEKTSSLFVAGYTRGEFAVGGPGGNSWETEERERFYDFLVIAMDADGGMVWSYQDAGRLPSEVRARFWLRRKGPTLINLHTYICHMYEVQ